MLTSLFADMEQCIMDLCIMRMSWINHIAYLLSGKKTMCQHVIFQVVNVNIEIHEALVENLFINIHSSMFFIQLCQFYSNF